MFIRHRRALGEALVWPGGFMETEHAIKIMRALANGHDPATGEPLQAGNLCLSAENVKALNCAFRIGS
jgi:hypothetical protein